MCVYDVNRIFVVNTHKLLVMDKRDIGQIFHSRLAVLAGRYDGNLSAFARAIGLDRSALSQFMAEDSTRLPRAETLCRIAAVHSVTLDWLLGLSSSDTLGAEMVPAHEIEEPLAGTPDTQLSRWHREAIGYKIRYVPKRIPDLLRLDDAALYEFSSPQQVDAETKIAEAHEQLAYTRRPETDMEVCMPRQTVELLAAGQGAWSGLPLSLRCQQLRHMAALQRELYPTFRLFFFDSLTTFSAPYTLFGPTRAALYLGELYLVINSTEHVRTLTRHFDNLIRQANIGPDRSADFIDGLAAAAA